MEQKDSNELLAIIENLETKIKIIEEDRDAAKQVEQNLLVVCMKILKMDNIDEAKKEISKAIENSMKIFNLD